VCDLHNHGRRTPTGEDEFFTDDARVHAFIARVRECIAANPEPRAACAAIEPHFQELLAQDGWLSDEHAGPNAKSGMGGGIGQWLLFRAGDGGLSLFSLVVPSGEQTPIHDHLAWGLIGLYRGEQEEDVFDADENGIELDRTQRVLPGGLYKLFPPRDDVHRVRTVSAESSVSIHLLTNDTGCIMRHTWDLDTRKIKAFRSGYANVACEDELPAEPVEAACS
jgi:predicted metal-dependent enzyme (double-stranded beta helix superfamily)